ncbi:MAG: hypothetical protein M3R00_05470 [Pseudomonadota bacterium]|nr:hypothetical protein [Pseudomonadota bacterium]
MDHRKAKENAAIAETQSPKLFTPAMLNDSRLAPLIQQLSWRMQVENTDITDDTITPVSLAPKKLI